MEKILEISDKDVGAEVKGDVKNKPRTAARAVIKNGNKVALLHVTKDNYYKLPGGGVDEGETIIDALHREILEEVGSKVKVNSEIGEILEHRSHHQLVQTSHCFSAELLEEGKPNFTEKELSLGFEVVWVKPEEALSLVKNGNPESYAGKFIILRDAYYLKKFLELQTNA